MTEVLKTPVHTLPSMKEFFRVFTLALCCIFICAFVLLDSADIAYCEETTPEEESSATTDAGTAIEGAVNEMTDRIYTTMRSIIMPCTAIGFAAAGFMFLLGGSQGTEKARRVIVACIAGLVLVIFAPLFAQAIATWFASNGGGDLSSYNPLN